jgi:hypothetical protein
MDAMFEAGVQTDPQRLVASRDASVFGFAFPYGYSAWRFS